MVRKNPLGFVPRGFCVPNLHVFVHAWYTADMATITISKNFISNDDLVIIPRKQYESLLRGIKDSNEETTANLDKDMLEALDDIKMGRVIGPFSTLSSGLKALKRAK